MKSCKKLFGYKHNWGKWEYVKDFELDSKNMQTGKVAKSTGRCLIQKRKCDDCGFVEVNQQKINY